MMFSRLLAAWLITLTLSAPAYARVKPADFDIGRNRLIAYMLSHQLSAQHFAHKSLDEIAPAAYDLYLSQLDPRKRFLLHEDVAELNVLRDSIDEELRRGQVVLPDKGLALFERRVAQVSDMTGKILNAGFDPNRKDYLEFDPEKIAYASNMNDLRDRWRRILKLQTLETYIDLKDEENRKTGEMDTNSEPQPAGETLDRELWAKALSTVREKNEHYLARLQQQTRQEQYNQFLDAVARAFDPHTNYMPPTSKEDFDIHMSGSLEGIGALLREDDGMIKVVRIIPGSAAERQGELQAEDTILSVAEKNKKAVDISDMRIREAVSYIRGPKGSEVLLTVAKPDGSKKTIAIVRNVVQIEETYVKSEAISDGRGNKIGYIRVPSFYRDFTASSLKNNKARNCTGDFRSELWKLHKEKISGLIIDLRDNGGGSLSDAVSISGLFLPGGPVVLVKNSQGEIKVLEDTDKNVVYDGPVIVLVNKFSASASEILAAALQDYNRALIIGGEHTHGKGTVQSIVDLNRNLPFLQRKKYENLGALKVTIQKFYRINGGSTQFKGITPDVVVPSVLNYLESGEKYLDYPLPWDRVEPVKYTPWTHNPFKVAAARRLSKQWIASTPDFKKIIERSAKAKVRAEQTQIPVFLKGVEDERKDLASLAGDENDESPHLGDNRPDDSGAKDSRVPLLEQLKKDPYVQLAVFLMDELALAR